MRESLAPGRAGGRGLWYSTGVERGLLPRFFERVTRQVFIDLALDDPPAARHLVDVLTRFARTDALWRVEGQAGRRIETVVEALGAIQEAWDVDSPGFAPERERALRRHVGDFALFMTGIFRDHVERLGLVGYYEAEGRRAYGFLAEIARAEGRPESPLFRRLARSFEQYAGALTYMRKVYFRDEALPWTGGPTEGLLRRLAAD